MQVLQAGAVVLVYAALCWWFFARRVARVDQPANARLLVAFASQGGEAEALAQRHAEVLGRQQPVMVLPLNQLNDSILSSVHTALFIASTYGEGEPPDNALRFARQWLGVGRETDLSSLHFAVLALGDSDYRQYCAFGTALDGALATLGARRLCAAVTVDRMDAASLQQWERHLESSGIIEEGLLAAGESLLGDAGARAFPVLACRLFERRELNPGSPGGPVYHLRFATPDTAQWQAGDIALFDVPLADGADMASREYSIASVPQQGSLDLLVRQVQKDDGTMGIGSGWLTATLPVGADIELKLRDNPSFQPPPDDRPMILIGNGTGIAGLRAHLQARELAGHVRNWLLFGERTRAHDSLFDSELQQWLDSGHLQRLDRVFSREGEDRGYVQDVLQLQVEALKQWLAEGASVYVCGSLEGMAPAVHRVLLDTLGETALEDLVLEGRYRRDVY